MRMRMISAAVALGLGFVGIALAQQAGGEGSPIDRAKQQALVAGLRAEVELLQLEHDIDADLLRKVTTDMRNLDLLEAGKEPLKKELKALKDRMPDPAGGIPNLLGLPGLKEFAAKAGEEEADREDLLNEVTARALRPVLDRMRREFVLKTTELNEKRMELAEAERVYDGKAK